MFKNKYSNILTIVLVVTIITILSILGILVYSVYSKYKNNRANSIAIEEFDNYVKENQTTGQELIEQNIVISQDDSSSSGGRNLKYYNNFIMIGYIEVPKIKIKYPVLEEETVASLEQSVAVRYPSHARLNEPGNVVIIGHNYRNGMFFSDLKKVVAGDKVLITDENGKTLTYTIYEIYETTPEDTGYITRDTGDNIEVTLVTCTDDSKARIIVKAKV